MNLLARPSRDLIGLNWGGPSGIIMYNEIIMAHTNKFMWERVPFFTFFLRPSKSISRHTFWMSIYPFGETPKIFVDFGNEKQA